MKVFTVILGATSAFAMHYTEPDACAETISYGLSKVADSMLSLRDHHNALDIISSLKNTYDQTRGLHETVVDCKKIALLPGVPTPKILPGVPPPEEKKILSGVPTPKYLDDGKILSGVPTPAYLEKNVTVASECLEDIQKIVEDALKAGHAIEDAVNAKSVERALEAVREVRKVEYELNEANTVCSRGEMKAEVLRSPCARKIDFALGQLFTMEKDIKAVIGGDIMHALAIEHELAEFPLLSCGVKEACNIADLEHEADEIKKVAHLKRRHFGWGIADKLKEFASIASSKLHEEAARAACLESSMSIVKHIKSIAGTIGESFQNMTLDGLQETDHLHSHVSNAIVECQKAAAA